MLHRNKRVIASSVLGLLAAAIPANAAISIDGNYDPAYGTPLAVQTNTTNASSQGGPDGSGKLTPNQSGGSYTQFTAAYGVIDVPNGKLDLFFSGSIFLNNTELNIAIDADPTKGVSKLTDTTVTIPGTTGNPGNPSAMNKIAFDTGFKPEKLFRLTDEGGRNVRYYDLVNNKFDEYGYSLDDPLVTPGTPADRTGTLAGSPEVKMSARNDAGGTIIPVADFTTITTGIEFQFDLTELGWVPGTPINASLFLSHGSGSGLTNQILGGFTYVPGHDFDYYYIDDHIGGDPGRQFTNDTIYGGNQYFTIAVPEPTMGFSMLGLAAMPLLKRRRKSEAK